MNEGDSTCVWIDVSLPAVQWVLVDQGIHGILHLPFGRTYPADLWVQPHRRCPVGGQRSLYQTTISLKLQWTNIHIYVDFIC